MTLRLVLMDGTIINGGSAGYSEQHLWLEFSGMTLQEAAMIFFDPSKTGRIQYDYGEMRDVYEGYTVCTNLFINSDNVINVCMVKGVTE